jgi:hypothetical protein
MFTLETPFEQKMKILDNEESSEHVVLKKRLKKTLYYGRMKNLDCPSLAMTELAVEYLQELVPRELGRIDMYWASSLQSTVSVTPCALMLALMYVKRLKDNNNPQYLSQVSSTDLFLISVLVASKYLYDVGEDDDVSNIRWALLTKLDIEDINENERSFLTAMNWMIFVKPDDFWNFLDILEKKVAWKMSLRRDNFTYTDLNVIVSNSPLCHVLFDALTEICKVVVACSIAYLACVTTVFVSSVTPVLVLSHVSLPLSPCFSVAPLVLSNASPSEFDQKSSSCFHASVQDRTFSPVSQDADVAAISSCQYLSQICKPWRSNWYPKMCVQASACVTVAFVREVVISVIGIICQATSALSLTSSYGLMEDLFMSQTARRSLPDGFTHCHHHGHCNNHNVRNLSQPPTSSTSYSSSDCISGLATSNNDCSKRPIETQQPKEKTLTCANKSSSGALPGRPFCSDADDYSCWNLPSDGSSPSQNYTMTFPSIPSSSQFAEVFG